MFGLSKKQPIAEHEATGEIERVYYEIKQSLRVTGVNLNFRTWAAYGEFLPLVWDVMRPNVETWAFESAADRLRSDAVRSVAELGPPAVRSHVSLGESQSFQIRAALDLYHYVNPKLLVFSSAVLLLLQGEEVGRATTQEADRLPRGVPPTMYSMEMESEQPDDEHLMELYRDIKNSLSLRSINSDYRTLALWPDYLSAAWQALKPLVQTPMHQDAANQLRETALTLARGLPYPVSLDLQAVKDAGAEIEEVVEITESFVQLLPGLILNMARLQLDWREVAELEESPFPAPSPQFEKEGVS
ncbi:halocarboxylic acid dehydrogenase DehI family protein [Allorhodopirellula solitaria]|uniref:2-haloacid dehalogenase, configuration-inverting n=1 Tax=Allorhodopirellula solitaria TaxID=2527987 RepID=A0A5C5WN97_9BACT|nr:halocarboxylic acid dehydrogenase DehI family protein [Allorhodopirellula solitaria]TWT51559.1 2-haloacid dehalogenase, configuration-inverting [Allorhodopirellula solitaria]